MKLLNVLDNISKTILYIFFAGVFIWGFLVVIKFSKNKKLSDEKILFYEKVLKKYKQIPSWKTKIIDYDKIYHKILNDIGHEGTFWEILKKEPNEISDIQKVWRLHKLRNKLVHDFDLLEESVLNKRAKEYEKMINQLLDKVS